MIQTRLQVPRIQTSFVWDQRSLLEHVDSAIKCPSPIVPESVAINRITETEPEQGALYHGFRRMSQPRVPVSPRAVDVCPKIWPAPQRCGSKGILKRRNDPFRTARPKRSVSFDSTQFHRPEEHYRKDEEFDRRSSSYTPGIYADLSGNGYEDASGCPISPVFNAGMDSFAPSSHDDLEKALMIKIQVSEPQDSLPLPRGWLSEQLQAYSSESTTNDKPSSSKKSKTKRSKKSRPEFDLSCKDQSCTSLSFQYRPRTPGPNTLSVR